MLGDIFYSLGTLAGTALGAIEGGGPGDGGRPGEPGPDTVELRDDDAESGDEGVSRSGSASGPDPYDDGRALVDTILGSAAGWVVKKSLRPRRVSWPRVLVAGIGATVLADVVGRALGPASEDRDRAYDEDPDALLVRLGAGIAMAAGYAALLYPRLPGAPLTRGLIFGAMEIAAAPHGGLVRVATDTPGLKFPLKDLAVPIDEDAGPLERIAFGVGLGLLYRPDLDRDGDEHEDEDDE